MLIKMANYYFFISKNIQENKKLHFYQKLSLMWGNKFSSIVARFEISNRFFKSYNWTKKQLF